MSTRSEIANVETGAEILIVDDQSMDADVLLGLFGGDSHKVRLCADHAAALQAIEAAAPDLILLNANAGDSNGLDLCRSLKSRAEYAGIPVVFLSPKDDLQTKIAAFELGCVDFVVVPFAIEEFRARIHFQLKQKRERDLLGFRAGHDPLTGLPNRDLLVDRLHQAVTHAERYERRVAVAYIDLDKFKFINDTLGHEAGDKLLVEVARRLLSCVRESDTVARLGGDEFVIVLYDQATEDITMHAMQRILHSIAEPILINETEVRTSCSIGFAFFPQDGGDVHTLLNNADAAMYRAKELGRNNFQFFTEELTERITRRVELEKELRGALERDEFVLHYQPRVDLRSGKVVGLEALIRWNHPHLGAVEPLRFIALAEEIGLMARIGHWVMQTACAQQWKWQRENVATLPISINISSTHFMQVDFVDQVRSVLQETGVEAHYLELEISESMSMQDPLATIEVLHELKKLGVRLVVDDFGTGYTNLNFLKQFPLDNIKLDRSFVCDIGHNPQDLAISDAVIAMAHSLHLRVTAEGVESASQLALLADRGCDEFQGNYFSAAIGSDACCDLLRAQRSVSPDRLGRSRTARTVMLVDDEPNVLTALSRSLYGRNYHILRARSASAALDLLAAHEVGVIICDQRMPKMTGVELFRRVRQMYPHTVRIMLSGYADLDSVTDAINLGAVYKFLNKPWSKAEICDIVEGAFDRYEAELPAEAASPA